MTSGYKDFDVGTRREPIRITAVGFRFVDLSHYSSRATTGSARKIGDGSHGSDKVATLWEIHPVFDIKSP